MRLYFDTTFLVDLERQREPAVALLENLPVATELWISAVSVAELLVGPYRRPNVDRALLKAKEVLGQFVWHEFDGTVAEQAALLQAGLLLAGKRVDMQDVFVAAGFLASGCDLLVTENKAHFTVHKPLAGRVATAKECAARLRKR